MAEKARKGKRIKSTISRETDSELVGHMHTHKIMPNDQANEENKGAQKGIINLCPATTLNKLSDDPESLLMIL